MLRRTLSPLLAVVLAACGTDPGPSGSASPGSSSQPTATATPTSIDLPDGLAGYAWVSATRVLDAGGQPVSTTVAGGPLGSPATFMESIPWDGGGGFTSTVVAGDVAVAVFGGVATAATRATSEVRLWRGSDGTRIGELSLPGTLLSDAFNGGPAALDVDRSLLYVAVRREAGGVVIRRMAFDGSADTTLVELDERFTPDAIPTERFTFGLDPSGTLVVLACGNADGCRLWDVEPDAAAAGAPRTLPDGTPTVCSGLSASEQWLVVSDDDVCFIDVGDAPFPMRAIDRGDASTHPISDESQVVPQRIVTIDGRELAVASRRNPDWSQTTLVTIDLESGARETVAGPFLNAAQVWLGLNPMALPGAWVLAEPWGAVDEPGASIPPARLVNVESGLVIELPAGTFGWH